MNSPMRNDDGQWCDDQGGIWDGANCELPHEEWDEEQWCDDQGGIWDEANCELPYEEWDEEQWCDDEGGTWDGANCELPYEEWDEEQWCDDQGGTWDGTNCEFPYEEWDEEQWCDDQAAHGTAKLCSLPYGNGMKSRRWCWSAPDEETCIQRRNMDPRRRLGLMRMITMTMALSGPRPMRQPATSADNGYKKKIGVTAGKIRVKFGMRAIKQPATKRRYLGTRWRLLL